METIHLSESLLQTLMSMGVGGLVAGLVLWWKRSDDKKHAEEIRMLQSRYMEELKAMYTRLDKRDEDYIEVIRDNTVAMVTLAERMGANSANLTRRG